MYKAMQIAHEGTSTLHSKAEAADHELGNSRLGFGVIMVMAAFVGVWGVACLIGGLASSGSFAEIGRSLITALTGM